jgi:UDP-glucose 4-epimerase
MIFVTGGAGYIGSHTCVELLQAGHQVTVFDNLSNASAESLARVERITGQAVRFVEGDIRDGAALTQALRDSGAQQVVHFAGLKAVGESVEQPLRYYDNNVVGTVRLLEAMQAAGATQLVFSSSATVYGNPQKLPLTEDHPLSATNPYGQTKLVIENMLRELQTSNPAWRIAILRYFNPVGAHPSGQIGEDPQGIPNNLLPFVTQVAIGKRPYLSVWGDDYDTPDGTGVRDYIHVVDLALGHLKALDRLAAHAGGFEVNLGTGQGYSVLNMVKAMERACGHEIPYQVAPRRAGDVAACYAEPTLAQKLLGWSAQFGLEQMCADAWRWQQHNPNGYRN